MKKIIVIENSDSLRKVLRLMISDIPDLSLIGEFNNAEMALLSIYCESPDVVLLDAHLSQGGSIDFMHAILGEFPHIKVLVASNFANPVCERIFLDAGAYAFFDKNLQMVEVLATMEALAKDDPLLFRLNA